MEKEKKKPGAFPRRGVMEGLLRRRDPSGETPLDPVEELDWHQQEEI